MVFVAKNNYKISFKKFVENKKMLTFVVPFERLSFFKAVSRVRFSAVVMGK